jgi:hypothetical protein
MVKQERELFGNERYSTSDQTRSGCCKMSPRNSPGPGFSSEGAAAGGALSTKCLRATANSALAIPRLETSTSTTSDGQTGWEMEEGSYITRREN